MRPLILCLIASVLTTAACDSGQSGLPKCSGSYNAAWTNCFGETMIPSFKFVGEFKDGKPNGKGTYTFSSGSKYVGEVKDGKRHGQGTYTWPNGEKYVGEFRNDMRHAQGTFTFPDGAKYVGEFKDNKYNGQGTYTLPDGRKYVGEYKDDKRNGQGIEYRADSSIQQSGIWEKGEFVRSQ